MPFPAFLYGQAPDSFPLWSRFGWIAFLYDQTSDCFPLYKLISQLDLYVVYEFPDSAFVIFFADE